MFRSRILRALAGVLVVLGLIAGGMYAVWAYGAQHPIYPGIRGCQYVRDGVARGRCYNTRIVALRQHESGAAFARRADKLSRSDANFANHCMEAMVPVGVADGRRARARHDRISSRPFTSPCLKGYGYGFIAGYVEHEPVPSIIRHAGTYCGVGGSDAPYPCLYALGLAFERRNRSLSASVRTCASIDLAFMVPGETPQKAGAWDHLECYKGVYVQRAYADRARNTIASGMCADGTRRQDLCLFFRPLYEFTLRGTLSGAKDVCGVYTRSKTRDSWCALGIAAVALSPEDCRRGPHRVAAACRRAFAKRASGSGALAAGSGGA